jgi:hypothetical protein
LSPTWGHGASTPNSFSDGMSFQLGFSHALLALLGLFAGWRNKIIITTAIFYIFYVLLMTPLAMPLWREITLFKYFQFPWRILSIIALLQTILISGIGNLLPRVRRPLLYGLLPIGLILLAVFHREQFIPYYDEQVYDDHFLEDRKRLEGIAFNDCNNFFICPRIVNQTIVQTRQLNAPMISADPNVTIKALPGNSPFRLQYQVKASSPSLALIHQIYFPGWRVLLDGKDIPASILEKLATPDGRLGLFLPAGNYRLEAFYDGPLGWREVNSSVAIILLTVALGYLLIRMKSPRTNHD